MCCPENYPGPRPMQAVLVICFADIIFTYMGQIATVLKHLNIDRSAGAAAGLPGIF